jgi:protein SCO1
MRSLLLPLLLAAAPLGAQGPGMPPTSSLESVDLAASQQDTIGATVDPDLAFVDEFGRPVQLRQWFPGDQPVVLMLGYYQCPAMCGQVLEAAFQALSEVDFEPGRDYRIVNVSIDPNETPAIALNRKQTFLPKLTKTGGDNAWRVLTGTAEATKALADAVGFRFYWADATKQFAHPPSLVFLTKQGTVSRVLVNTAFDPYDVRLALVEAAEGKLGTFVDRLRLNCLTFDARTNSYSLAAMTLMRIGGAVTLVVLALMIWTMLRKERRANGPQTQPSALA